MEKCYYNNITKQYFFTKHEFEDMINCDHLERCPEYDESFNVIEKIQSQAKTIEKLTKCVDKLSDIRNQRDLYISEFDSGQGIQDVLEYVELVSKQTLAEIKGEK